MGIFLAGQTAVYGSPPGAENVQYEVAAGRGDGGILLPEVIATLEAASDRAMQQALAVTAIERAQVMDTSFTTKLIADLRANKVDRKTVARLTKRMDKHRWRDRSNHYAYAPADKIYRPGWQRKICECEY